MKLNKLFAKTFFFLKLNYFQLFFLFLKSKKYINQKSLQLNIMNEKLLKFFKVLTTFFLGYLFFQGLIEKLIKSLIVLCVKLFLSSSSSMVLNNVPSDTNTTIETILNETEEEIISVKFLVIQMASGGFLTLLVFISLFSVWMLKKSSKLITLNCGIMCFYCLITSIYSSIMTTLQLRIGVTTSEKYLLVLDSITFVLIQVACASCLFLVSKLSKLLNKP